MVGLLVEGIGAGVAAKEKLLVKCIFDNKLININVIKVWLLLTVTTVASNQLYSENVIFC